jgi:hypothetical protein
MSGPMSRSSRASFVVRVVEDRHGQVGGVVERVATGAKETFRDLDALGRVIREMLRDDRPFPPDWLAADSALDETSGLSEPP